MIPNSSDIAVTNTIQGETGRFEIHAGSLDKLMILLTDLYSDPAGAVVREYLTNAWDSQKLAERQGTPWRPIEVFTPTSFSKDFRIRDFGVGLSVDDLAKVYSQYGLSTKDTENNSTGMLGLGCKSALTYTGQFTITAWKDGVRARAVVSKTDSGVPEYTVIDTRATDEPNGVEISIPTRNASDLVAKLRGLVRWWPVGSVLIDGVEPEKHNMKPLGNGLFYSIRQNGYGRNSFIIMGNVAYPVASGELDNLGLPMWIDFAAYVDMRAVDFTPSREALFYTERTKSVLSDTVARLKKEVAGKMRQEFEQASLADARNLVTGWQYSVMRFITHGGTIPLTHQGHPWQDSVGKKHRYISYERSTVKLRSSNQYSVQSANHTPFIVINMPERTPPRFAQKAQMYFNSRGTPVTNRTPFFEDDPSDHFISDLPRVDAADIMAIKVPSGRKPASSGYVFRWGDESETGTTIPSEVKGKTLFYVTPADLSRAGSYRRPAGIEDILALLGDEFVGVRLTSNRVQKFLRLNSQAVTFKRALQHRVDSLMVKAGVQQLPEIQVTGAEYGARSFLRRVSPSSLLDPKLQEAALAVGSETQVNASQASAQRLVTWARNRSIDITLAPREEKTLDISDYPLLNGAHYKASLDYANDLYKSRTAVVD